MKFYIHIYIYTYIYDITIISRFLQGIWFHTLRKDVENTSSLWFSPKTVTAIIMFYRNTKVEVRSQDGDTDFFDIMVGVLQGDIWAPYQFITCLDYVLRTSRNLIYENSFTLKKAKSRRYVAETITNAHFVDDVGHLSNTSAQAEYHLH